MRQFSATVCAAFALVSLVLVAHAQGPAASSAGRAGRQTYHVPRTPWGDPDLEGKWPGSSASGIPLQRAESLGTRDTLTDAEFADRVAQAERQKDQDVADFDFEHPSVPFGRGRWRAVAAAALVRTVRAAAPGVADRRSAERPSAGHDAGRTAARRRAARARERRLGLVHGLHPHRALHHARPRRFGPPRWLQQREPDRAVARVRDVRQRDDPRSAHRAARQPAASRSGDSKLPGRLARPLGRRHAGGRDHELPRSDGRRHERHRRQRRDEGHGTLYAHQRHHPSITR